MIRVFLSHEPEALENFYGGRAIRELKEFAEVRVNDSGRVLTSDMLLEGSRGCDVVVLDRNTPADAEFSQTVRTSPRSIAALWISAPSTSLPRPRPVCW